jgi:AcrR family transcriptional regulator
MSSPPPPTESPKRAAERIRDSARELFYREGIRAVGVDEVVNHAGVTKPSLYRAFASKDDLAAACLREQEEVVWRRFDRVQAAHPGEALAQLRAYFAEISRRVREEGFRGCPLSNAAVEFPRAGHPARRTAEAHKAAYLSRLTALAEAAGAKKPAELAGGLLLLIEGAFSAVQLFGPDGPQTVVADAAEALIGAYCPG